MELKLGDVQTTALIPLAVKANETLRKNARIKDKKAVEIIRTLNIHTEQYDKFMSHEGVIARTIMLDRQLKEIIKRNPDTVVVNVGAGFDDRFSRMDNGKILWFDLDLPESDEYMTVGGLILHAYESFPKLNEEVQVGKYTFKILKNTMTKIEIVRLKVNDES